MSPGQSSTLLFATTYLGKQPLEDVRVENLQILHIMILTVFTLYVFYPPMLPLYFTE